MGDAGQLVYTLGAHSPYMDVEPSSGLVYVVSVLGLPSGLIEVQVKVTDPAGLTSVTTLEVRQTHGHFTCPISPRITGAKTEHSS